MADKPKKRLRNGCDPAAIGKATQFQPGNPGGPGRPKTKPISDALMAALLGSDQKELIAVVKAIVDKAKDGDVQAFNSIRDTTEGKPVQQLDVKGEIKGTVILSSVPRPQRTA